MNSVLIFLLGLFGGAQLVVIAWICVVDLELRRLGREEELIRIQIEEASHAED